MTLTLLQIFFDGCQSLVLSSSRRWPLFLFCVSCRRHALFTSKLIYLRAFLLLPSLWQQPWLWPAVTRLLGLVHDAVWPYPHGSIHMYILSAWRRQTCVYTLPRWHAAPKAVAVAGTVVTRYLGRASIGKNLRSCTFNHRARMILSLAGYSQCTVAGNRKNAMCGLHRTDTALGIAAACSALITTSWSYLA